MVKKAFLLCLLLGGLLFMSDTLNAIEKNAGRHFWWMKQSATPP